MYLQRFVNANIINKKLENLKKNVKNRFYLKIKKREKRFLHLWVPFDQFVT